MKRTESKKTLPQFVEVKRAIIYARVSTDQQAEYGTSIDTQVEKSLAYAESKGMKVVGIFKEDYSAMSLDRPELNKVRAMLGLGQADVLIIYKADRQDRSWAGLNYLLFLQELKQLGIEFHKSEQGRQINLNDDTQIFFESIEGWQAGTDHKRTVERLHKGRINTARKGHVVANGHSPFGYKEIRNEKTRRYEFVIVEDEAEVVRQIFHRYVSGDESGKALGTMRIAHKLSSLGIETYADRRKGIRKKMGRGQWPVESVRNILRNETYIGTWKYAKKEWVKRDYVGQSEPVDIPVEVPAIIKPELFELAKQRREARAKTSNRRKYEYLLSGRIKCGCCGYAMSGKARKRKEEKVDFYYQCMTKYQGTQRLRKCDSPHFRTDQVGQSQVKQIKH